MAARRVFSEFKNTHQERVTTEEFIQRCKTMYSQGEPCKGQENIRQVKYEVASSALEQTAIKTFISLLSDIATRCQSLEGHIKDLRDQVSNLQKTVQDMCDTKSETKCATKTPLEEPITENTQESKETPGTQTPDAVATSSDAATSTSSSSTDDLKARLQRLQWKTFDLHRQNELLRRMLEIQCTVNENAAAAAAASVHKKKDSSTADERRGSSQTIQQADSTSNTTSTSTTDPSATLPSSLQTQDKQSIHATSTSADPILNHEEYVPLSAEEMLSQSFVDPKVPWSTNDGTTDTLGKKDTLDGFKSQEPDIKYAYVYAPCPKEDLLRTPQGKVTFGSSPITPPPQCSLYSWERRREGGQGNINSDQKPHWKP